jgi:hypothetical protein
VVTQRVNNVKIANFVFFREKILGRSIPVNKDPVMRMVLLLIYRHQKVIPEIGM